MALPWHTTATHRVGRRKLLRHAAAIRREVAKARREAEDGGGAELAALLDRLERQAEALEVTAATAPVEPAELTLYDPSNRD